MQNHKKHIKYNHKGGPNNRVAAERLLGQMIQTAFPESDRPILIAVGGPGGTGKTTFAGRLAGELGDAVILSLDDYKTSRAERREANIFGPHPSANRMALIASHLEFLRDGQGIAKPVYDRVTGDACETVPFQPECWILVEGEVATYEEFRKLIHFSIFIDSDWRTQLATRIGRDLDSRNYSPDKAISTFLHSNLREFVEHGADSKRWADVHLFCNDRYRLTLESIDQSLYKKIQDRLSDEIDPVELEGLVIPLLTPFAVDGSIDERAFLEHIDWLAQAGARRIIVGDTAGEYFSLTVAERLELLELALEYFPGLVWMQIGGGPIPEAVHLGRESEQLGADGAVCLPPANCADATDKGSAAYIAAIRSYTDIPIMLPNQFLPNHDSALEISNFSNVIGVIHDERETDPIPPAPLEFHRSNRPFKHMDAFISAAANIWPELYVELERSIPSGESSDRGSIAAQIDKNLAKLGSPTPRNLKQMLKTRLPGFPVHLRPPLGNAYNTIHSPRVSVFSGPS